MKKTISLIVIALFILSAIPLAFAEDTEVTSAREKFKEARELAKENYKKTVEQYKEAREKFKESREKIKDNREKLKECVGLKTDKCNNIRATVKANAKPFLTNSADAILKLLENLKNKVEASNLEDAEKAELIAEIDASIAKINEAKVSADALTEGATNEEIKESAKEIKEAWKEARKDVKRIAGELVHFRVGEIIKKAEKLEDRLNRVLEKAKAAGKDTSALQSLIDQFHQKIADARQKYENAKAKYTEAKTAGDVDALVKEANALLKEAHKDLKEAHRILKDIVRELKEKNTEKELEETKESAEATEGTNSETDSEEIAVTDATGDTVAI